ncbi:MAG: hypothetical protein FJY55_10300 [Betaproteobacteria bacterium]|nr:hypothetical protein [Betaproteobacteria bacterium]
MPAATVSDSTGPTKAREPAIFGDAKKYGRAREIEDRGFPRGQPAIARWSGRHLPVIAHAFGDRLLKARAAEPQVKDRLARTTVG